MQMLSHVEAHVNNLRVLMPIFYICFPSAAVMKCSLKKLLLTCKQESKCDEINLTDKGCTGTSLTH